MASGVGEAQAQSLGEFLERVRSAEYAAYATRPDAKVANEAAFAEMKAYLLGRYGGVDLGQVRQVFVDEGGSVFDCIPAGQQPAMRDSPPTTRPAPDLPRPSAGAGEPRARPGTEATPGDAACPPGTIPLQRITLETLVGFESLRGFYRK